MLITNLVGTAKISLATLAGAAAGVAADASSTLITESTHITLGYAVAAATPVVLLAWYLSSKLTHIMDRLERLESIISNLPGAKHAERAAHFKKLHDDGD